MMNYLISAYSVNPYKGSEDSIGWNWVLQYEKNYKEGDRIILLTKKFNEKDTRRGLKEFNIQHVELVIVDVPDALNWFREILSLISAVFLVDYVPILQYADELVTILLLPYMVLGTIKRCTYIDKCIRNIICLFVLIGLIGIASTVLNKVQPDKFAVCLDMLTLSKIIICPIGMYFLLNEHNSEEIIRILTPMAKFFLWSGLACAVVSQFLNIGMTEYERNGIKSFYFIVGFQHLFSILVLCALLIILSKKYDLRYILIAIVQMILTLKGPSIIWSVTILFILYYFKRDREKIDKWVYVVLLLFCIIFGQFQIQNYFLNDTAPRLVLLNYGLKTALAYFPLGSGFATYGSPVAASYYSPLYQLYGFNNKYGMSKTDTSFLNDNCFCLRYVYSDRITKN